MTGRDHDIEIEAIVENSDGSLTVTLNMGFEALKTFAALGVYTTLLDKAKEAGADGYLNPKGAEDKGTGEGGADPLSGDFPTV